MYNTNNDNDEYNNITQESSNNDSNTQVFINNKNSQNSQNAIILFNTKKITNDQIEKLDIGHFSIKESKISRNTDSPFDPRFHANNVNSIQAKLPQKLLFPLLKIDQKWIAGEPSNCVFIRGVLLDTNSVQLEMQILLKIETAFESVRLKSQDLGIVNIEVANESNFENVDVSLVFLDGFRAYECVKLIRKLLSWNAFLDSSNRKKFFSIRNKENGNIQNQNIKSIHNNISTNISQNTKTQTENRKEEELESKTLSSFLSKSMTPNSKFTETKHQKKSCNPYVPCLIFPFSEFELNRNSSYHEDLLKRAFPTCKFPSFRNVERGKTSWHVHFSREIDVIEADFVLRCEKMVIDNISLNHMRWNLTKDGYHWRIPDGLRKIKQRRRDSVDSLLSSYESSDTESSNTYTNTPNASTPSNSINLKIQGSNEKSKNIITKYQLPKEFDPNELIKPQTTSSTFIKSKLSNVFEEEDRCSNSSPKPNTNDIENEDYVDKEGNEKYGKKEENRTVLNSLNHNLTDSYKNFVTPVSFETKNILIDNSNEGRNGIESELFTPMKRIKVKVKPKKKLEESLNEVGINNSEISDGTEGVLKVKTTENNKPSNALSTIIGSLCTKLSMVDKNNIKDKEKILLSKKVQLKFDLPSTKTGSAKTEGFFKLSQEEKDKFCFKGKLFALSATSLKNFQVYNSTNSTINPFSTTTAPSTFSTTGRTQRAQTRQIGIPRSIKLSSELFKKSSLQSTQKLVSLENSSIHSYGLVLMESAEPGDLIIEYVGELIRSSVASMRELRYEQEYRGDGIASSYLFRLDDIRVIDASYMGNLARFINHSCDPNCVAKTIFLNGSKRIVMYAKKHIKSGEEITYDYKFPVERDPSKKIKCLCKSSNCRKFLN